MAEDDDRRQDSEPALQAGAGRAGGFDRGLAGLLWALIAAFGLLLAGVVAARIGYPYELEWMASVPPSIHSHPQGITKCGLNMKKKQKYKTILFLEIHRYKNPNVSL